MVIKLIMIGFMLSVVFMLVLFLIQALRNGKWIFSVSVLFFIGVFSYVAYTIYKTPVEKIYRETQISTLLEEAESKAEGK